MKLIQNIIYALICLSCLLGCSFALPKNFLPIKQAQVATTQISQEITKDSTGIKEVSKDLTVIATQVQPVQSEAIKSNVLKLNGITYSLDAQTVKLNEVTTELKQTDNQIQSLNQTITDKDKQIAKLQADKNSLINKVWLLLYTIAGLSIAAGVGLCFVNMKTGISISIAGISLLVLTYFLQTFLVPLAIGMGIVLLSGIGFEVWTHKDLLKLNK